MKIRIKNSGNKITEALDNPAKLASQLSPFNYYNANIKKQFMQELMKENILVNVALGEDLPNPIVFQKAPRDLQNIMSAMQTNKATKTRGFESWNMDDPIATYNAAEDFCLTIFGNSNRTNIASNKTEVSLNKANIASTSESIIFNLENQLNEVTTAGAVAAGALTGMVASNLINSAAGFGAGLASTLGTTIAIHLGIIAAVSSGIGAVAGMNTDATPNGVIHDNESLELNDPNKLLMNNITTLTKNFSNAQAAIKSYIEKILVSLNNYISVVSPGSVLEYRKISKFVLLFMHLSTKLANAFVETRLPEIEELEKKQEQKRENRQLRKLELANEIKDFLTLINKMFRNIKNNPSDAIKLLEIQKYYEENPKKRGDLMDVAGEGKDALIGYFDKQISNASNHTDKEEERVESLNNNFSNKLNEANEELGEGNKPDLNLKPIYDKLSSKLKLEFEGLFDNFDKNKIEGLDDAKEHMKLLIEEADKTIKDRIEKLTKTSQSSGNETGLTKAAVQFLAGHPLEADNLLEIWSRHLVDLKLRMSKRLKIMTDITNTTRTLGWTMAFVKETMPEILARLLTYRYAYLVLSNKGVYSYDTAKARRDSEFYDSNPVIAENYRNSELGILTWILENISQQYTNDGNSLVVPDENGGFKLNNNYLAYATLFCNKLGIPLELQQNGETIKTAVTLSQLNKSDNINASDDALMSIISNYLNNNNYYSINAINAALSSNNTEAAERLFNLLYLQLLLNNDEKKEKELIETTYNEIKEIISSNPIEDNNYKDIFYTFNIILNSNSTDIYNTFINNKDNINELIEKYQNAKTNKNTESLNEVKLQIHNIFLYVPFGNVNKNETAWKNIITDIFKEPGQVDYYSYISSFISENNSIEDNCKMAPTLVKLTLSGILSYVDTEDKEDQNTEEQANELSTKLQSIRTFFSDINLGDKEILNNKENENNPEYQEETEKYKEERNTVRNQLIDAYKEASKDSTYKIKALYNNDVKSLYEANTGEKQEETNKDWFNELLAKGIQFDKPEDIKTAFGSIKVIDCNDANKSKEFNKLDDKDKNIVLLNLASAIEKVNDNNAIKNLVDEILKKWGIDIEKAKEDADIEAALPGLLTKSNDYFNKVKEVKIKMESDNTDEKVKDEYDTYKNEVIKLLSDSYKTNAKGFKYKIKALYKDNINTLTEDQKTQDSIKKDNWFNGLITCFTTFKSIDNIRTAFANVKIIEVENDNEYKFSDETINKTILNKILYDLCNALETVKNDGKLNELLATLLKLLGIDVDKENQADMSKRNLLTVISKARALSNRIILSKILETSDITGNTENNNKIKELKEKVESEIKANYTKILEQNKSEYMFNIDDNDFYKNFYKAIITFRPNAKDQGFRNTISAIGVLPIKLVKLTDSQNKKVKVNDIDNINTKYIILYDFCLAIAETDNNGYSITLKNKLDEIIKLSKKQSKNESYIFYGEKQYKLNSYMLYENTDTIENDQKNYTSDNISPDEFSNILDKIEKNNTLKKEVEDILDVNDTDNNTNNKLIINNLDNIILIINNFNLKF